MISIHPRITGEGIILHILQVHAHATYLKCMQHKRERKIKIRRRKRKEKQKRKTEREEKETRRAKNEKEITKRNYFL